MKRIFIAAALLMSTTFFAGAQDFEGKKVPAEFTIELDFSQGTSPFATPFVNRKKQTAEGETYVHVFGTGKKECKASFVICKGPNDNFYSFGNPKFPYLNFERPQAQPDNCGYIKLPAVPDRYLKSIEVTIATSDAVLLICKAPEKAVSGSGLVAKFKVPGKGTATQEFEYPKTELGTAYYLYRSTSSAFRISNMKLTYSSAKKAKK